MFNAADESRLLALLNDKRRALGLPEVRQGATQTRLAHQCVEKNLLDGGFSHCDYEVLFAATNYMTPETILAVWFNSAPHKAALTYSTSRFAGAAIGKDDHNRWVAAINIDY